MSVIRKQVCSEYELSVTLGFKRVFTWAPAFENFSNESKLMVEINMNDHIHHLSYYFKVVDICLSVEHGNLPFLRMWNICDTIGVGSLCIMVFAQNWTVSVCVYEVLCGWESRK